MRSDDLGAADVTVVTDHGTITIAKFVGVEVGVLLGVASLAIGHVNPDVLEGIGDKLVIDDHIELGQEDFSPMLIENDLINVVSILDGLDDEGLEILVVCVGRGEVTPVLHRCTRGDFTQSCHLFPSLN